MTEAATNVQRQRRLCLAALATLPWQARLAGAQSANERRAYPTRPVKIIVPFAAGGTTDVVARLAAEALSRALKQPFNVENRGGAGGNLGARAVAQSPGDGYTLLVSSGSVFTVNPHLYKSPGFDVRRDLTPISALAEGPLLLAVSPNHPARTLADFIAWARQQGAGATFGSAGVGSQSHLVAERFATAAGIEPTHVPYKGESAAATELAAGHISFAFLNLGSGTQLVRAGQVRALAVTSQGTVAALPSVPTFVQAGLEGFSAVGWFALHAPGTTPTAIVKTLEAAARQAAQDNVFAARMTDLGMTTAAGGGDALAQRIQAESQLWAEFLRRKKIQLD